MEADVKIQQLTGLSGSGRAARKAALRLSGVADKDRHWVLSRLTVNQRDKVEEAYGQLQRIRGDTQLDFGLFFGAGNETNGAHQPSELDRINETPFAEVRNVVDNLPLEYVAAIIQSGRWQEAQLYLKTCQKRRRQAIATAGGPPVNAAVVTALIDAVARRAEAELN